MEQPEPQCGGCGRADIPLFFIPGGWGWTDDLQDGRIGLCLDCGQSDERYLDQFRAHFGDIKFISDSDAGQSGEWLDPGKPGGLT